MYRQRIREFRKIKGLRLKDLSELSGVGVSTIGELELQKHDATVTTLINLCLALDVSPNEILEYKKLRHYYKMNVSSTLKDSQ